MFVSLGFRDKFRALLPKKTGSRTLGQCFALQNFRGDPRGELTNSEALPFF